MLIDKLKSGFLLYGCFMLCLSCQEVHNDIEEIKESAILSIYTDSDNISSRALDEPKDKMVEGDAIHIILVNEETGEIHQTAKATFLNGKWIFNNPVILNEERYLLYSFYPYDESITDFSNVLINATKNIDYMYQNPAKVTTVSANRPVGFISFKHVFATVILLMKTTEPIKYGQLIRYPRISQKESDIHYIRHEGYLNIFTGKINSNSGVYGYYRDDFNYIIPDKFPTVNSQEAIQYFLFPTEDTVVEEKLITLHCVFDTYRSNLAYFPYPFKLEAGNKYIYYVVTGSNPVTIERIN